MYSFLYMQLVLDRPPDLYNSAGVEKKILPANFGSLKKYKDVCPATGVSLETGSVLLEEQSPFL